MKKIILCLIAICSVCLAVAQTESPKGSNLGPVCFMGIPVTGNLSEFVLKVEEKGFTVSDESSGNMPYLKGLYLGEKADILILSTEGSQQVYGVLVMLQQNNNWNIMKGDFNILKKSFTEQYGKPEKNDHSFTQPFNDVQDEMKKVELGMCDYSCSWSTPHVELEITKSARIIITYENDANFHMYAGL